MEDLAPLWTAGGAVADTTSSDTTGGRP
jgi:hypothetical protein